MAGAIPGLTGGAAAALPTLPGLGAAAIPGLRLPGLAPKAEGPVYTGQVVDYNEARPPRPCDPQGMGCIFFVNHPVLSEHG